MIFQRIDWRYLFLLLLFLVAEMATYFLWTDILYYLKEFFTWPQLNLASGALSATITIVYKIKFRKFSFTPNMSFNDFKIPVEDFISFFSNPVTFVISLSLARSLFLQSIGYQTYFKHFTDIELIFIAIVTSYLLYISSMELIRYFKVIAFKTETVTAAVRPGNDETKD